MQECALTIQIVVVVPPWSNFAVTPLITTPTNATITTVFPATGCGCKTRWIASSPRNAVTPSNKLEFSSGEKIESIGVADAGTAAGQPDGTPGDQEAEDIAEIVARIGEEREGIAQEAEDGLGDNESEVEDEADFEGAIDFEVVVVRMIMHRKNTWLHTNRSEAFRE
jgi:hypothetical protein